MQVKEVIKQVCEFMEKFDTIDAISAGEVLAGEDGEFGRSIVSCINLVLNEIATEFIPNIKIEKVNVSSGKLQFSDLSHGVIEILSVKDSVGNELDFESFADHITLARSGMVEVRYNATPETLSYDSEFETTIPARVLGYGVMREYYFIQTQYEDAGMWEERFKNSLQALTRKKSNTVIAWRRWE